MDNTTNQTSVKDTERTGFFENVLGFFADLGSFFGSILNALNPLSEDFILNGLIEIIGSILDYLNPLSENFILKGLLQFIGSILDRLNPFSENFILKDVLTFLGDILSFLNPLSENFFAYKLIDLLKEALRFLFVPSEERITALTNTVTGKFDFIESIKIGINSMNDMLNNIGNAPKLTLNLGATKYTDAFNATIIDFSFYAPYKTYGDLVLTGFIYISFLWRLFITLPNTINGAGGTSVEFLTAAKTMNKRNGGK